MKVVYCANCGMCLKITRKALPKLHRIIDVVEYHECTDQPMPLDLEPLDVPTFAPDNANGHDKFVKNLNRLSPKSVLGAMGSDSLKDRRMITDRTASSAPIGALEVLKSMTPKGPEREGDDPESEA